MGKENIIFFTLCLIFGKIFATFSSDPEPTTSTEFGKNDLSVLLCEVGIIRAQLRDKVNICGERLNLSVLFGLDR